MALGASTEERLDLAPIANDISDYWQGLRTGIGPRGVVPWPGIHSEIKSIKVPSEVGNRVSWRIVQLQVEN